MNDAPGARQTPSVTESQRDGGPPEAVDEESPDKNVTKMSYKHTKALVGTAQKLRKQMTDEEKTFAVRFFEETTNNSKSSKEY